MLSRKPVLDSFVHLASLVLFLFLIFMITSCQRPLTQLDNQNRVSVELKQEDGSDVDGYDYCGDEETCSGPAIRSGEVWCQLNNNCSAQKDCGCNLFQRERGIIPYNWKFKAKQVKKVKADTKKYEYTCWCTKEH